MNSTYDELDSSIREVYKELNWAKLELARRPEVAGDYTERNSGVGVVFRPLMLPIIYNVQTGRWSFSPVVATPLGNVVFSLGGDDAAGETQRGPVLWKIQIGNKARYVKTTPGMKVCLQEEQLRMKDVDHGAEMMTLVLEPIRRPTNVSLEESERPIRGIRVLRAIPVNGKETRSRR